jgi:outer membrane protein OmpA-like peptidoglycan-associated protein
MMTAVGMSAVGANAHGQSAPSTPAPFMIFFDWNKGEIRRDDAAVLDRVAETWQARPGASLRLSGHTDRSGNAAANRLAGMRRAETVRQELERRGVPRNAIKLISFGEERPLVPTEDGVREVQNRRVEIDFEE